MVHRPGEWYMCEHLRHPWQGRSRRTLEAKRGLLHGVTKQGHTAGCPSSHSSVPQFPHLENGGDEVGAPPKCLHEDEMRGC